ncbi:MAG: hypothetical protein ACKOA7_06550 [Bacteroidota bacterium]
MRKPYAFLFLLCHWLPIIGVWAQTPTSSKRPQPETADTSHVPSGSDDFSNEESLDVPENLEWIPLEQFDERMMQIDEANFIQKAINLCSISWDELVGSGLLSTLQASAWVAYRKLYGCPSAWYELQAVHGFDTALIRTLRKRTTLEPEISFHSLGYSLQHGRATLMLRSTRNLSGLRRYEPGGGDRLGFSAYRGGPQAHLWQIRHSGYRHRLVLSLPKVQGAYGMGQLGGGLMMTSDHGLPRATGVTVGDYHLRIGLGLSWNTGMSGSLTSGIMGLRWMGQSMGVASGTATSVQLRGIGFQKELKKGISVLVWSAYQRPDVRLLYGSDSSQVVIGSLPLGGMTRTQAEWQGRRGSTFQSYGMSVMKEYKQFKIMIYSSLYKYNLGFTSKNLPWPSSIVPPQRNELTGLSYHHSGRRWEWSGEWSLSGANGLSTLQQLILTPHARLQTAWIGRRFAPGAAPPFAGALGRQSSPINEEGFTWMTQRLGKGRSRMLCVADFYRHPMPRFGTPLPAHGHRINLQYEWWPHREHQLLGRLDVRKEWGGQNLGLSLPSISGQEQKSWVLSWNHQSRQSPIRECRVRFDGRTNTTNQTPFLVRSVAFSTRIRWVVGPWRLSVQQAWVNAQEGTGAFYFFEPAPRFASGMSSVSGRAIRQVFLAEYRISPELRAWIRFDRTRYHDRERAGSGWEMTSGPFRAACTLQLLYSLSGPRSFTHEKIAHWHENPLQEPNDAVPTDPK